MAVHDVAGCKAQWVCFSAYNLTGHDLVSILQTAACNQGDAVVCAVALDKLGRRPRLVASIRNLSHSQTFIAGGRWRKQRRR